MTDLYSYYGGDPYPLPSDMSRYNIKNFKLAPEKPFVPADKRLEWNGTDWFLRECTEGETIARWIAVRIKRNELLANSDTYIIRSMEAGTEISQEWKDYRQALRDVTTQESPWFINWPTPPQV